MNSSELVPILNSTGLAAKDPRTYQVLRALIDNLTKAEKSIATVVAGTSSGGGGGTVTNVTNHQYFLDLLGGDSDGGDATPIPGGQGAAGNPGSQGVPGVTTTIVFTEDSISESDSLIPGPRGNDATGIQGATGPQGIQGVPLIDVEYPEEPLVIPGKDGNIGATGGVGPAGATIFLEPDTPEDPLVITGPTGPLASMVDFTQDLGSGESSGTFDITGLAGLTVNQDVTIVQTAQAIASKGNAHDEFEMDAIQLTGYVLNSTTIRVYWWSPSVAVGTYAFAFGVSPSSIAISSAGALVKIQQIVTTTSQTTVDFTNIPATYSSLLIKYISQDQLDPDH